MYGDSSLKKLYGGSSLRKLYGGSSLLVVVELASSFPCSPYSVKLKKNIHKYIGMVRLHPIKGSQPLGFPVGHSVSLRKSLTARFRRHSQAAANRQKYEHHKGKMATIMILPLSF